jgi:hypothetical protein
MLKNCFGVISRLLFQERVKTRLVNANVSSGIMSAGYWLSAPVLDKRLDLAKAERFLNEKQNPFSVFPGEQS